MLYRLLADLTVVAHLAFVLFAILGGLAVARRRWVACLHLPAALWAVCIEFAGWTCPLTPLENWLRIKGGASGYSESFVEHYLLPVLYPAGLTRNVQVLLGASALLVNLGIYWRIWQRPAN